MAQRRYRFHDVSTSASNPGRIVVSRKLLRCSCPDLYGLRGLGRTRRRMRRMIVEHMDFGDSRAVRIS